MRSSNIISVVCCLSIFFAGCTAMQNGKKPSEGTNKTDIYSEKVLISPSRSYEECFELNPGSTMEYAFRSSDPVTFNIHYHGADRVHYPVSMANITNWKGVLDPERLYYYTDEQEFFCLMWENPGQNEVAITYECRVKK